MYTLHIYCMFTLWHAGFGISEPVKVSFMAVFLMSIALIEVGILCIVPPVWQTGGKQVNLVCLQ